MSEQKWQVSLEENGLRFDRFLAQAAHFSRNQAQGLIHKGWAEVNGETQKPSHELRSNDAVTLRIPAPKKVARKGSLPKAWVLHEDPDILVLNKPAGLVVHPAPGCSDPTLVDHLKNARPDLALLSSDRFGLAHRLDKDTSGVLVVAKTPQALDKVSKQFSGRTVEKEYWAIVNGRPKNRSGLVTAPIGRSQKKQGAMAVDPQGRFAETAFELLAESSGCSLLRLIPHTGRTHQIRVHLKALGLPLVGDKIYGEGVSSAPRQMLHARKLKILHPSSNRPLVFEAPVPEDFRTFWRSVGGRLDAAFGNW